MSLFLDWVSTLGLGRVSTQWYFASFSFNCNLCKVGVIRELTSVIELVVALWLRHWSSDSSKRHLAVETSVVS